MTEVRTIDGSVLFSYDENTTTLKEEISKYKDLREANLKGASIGSASLVSADLRGADLSNADLRRANIKWANLRGANLSGADLTESSLFSADLSGADLSNADLKWANLYNSTLCNVSLNYANLSDARLYHADLKGAELKGANLSYADLSDAKNVPDIDFPMACPSEGSFIAWKKVNDCYIIKLEIPEDAKRSSATSRKCRCSKAKVLEIKGIYTGENINEVVNRDYTPCTYKVGEMVYPDSFNDNRWEECSHGIHFFVDRTDAINY